MLKTNKTTTDHSKSDHLCRALGPVGPSSGRWMIVCPSMASSWLPGHGQAHCNNHASHVYTYLFIWISPITHLFVALMPTSWTSNTKLPSFLLHAPSDQVTCKKEQEFWRNEGRLWELERKEERVSNTNLTVRNCHIPGWLVCGTRLWQAFPTLSTKAHQVREKQQQCHGNDGGRDASNTAPSRKHLQQIKIICSQLASSLYFILMALTFFGIHVQNSISTWVAKDDAKDERKKFSSPMATTWPKSVNISLSPYALYYAIQFFNAVTYLQGNFLGFQASTCMQDQDTIICSRSIPCTYLFAEGNTSMPNFQNMGLGLNFNPILFYMHYRIYWIIRT